MTIGVPRALRDAWLSVPRDTALCCSDDFAWADLFQPRLTTSPSPERRSAPARYGCCPTASPIRTRPRGAPD